MPNLSYYYSIEDPCSFWNTCLDSDRPLIGARICLRPTISRETTLRRPIRVGLNDEKTKDKFQEQLRPHLGNFENETDRDVA